MLRNEVIRMFAWYQKKRNIVAICYGVVYLIGCYLILLTYIPKNIVISEKDDAFSLDAPVSIEKDYRNSIVETGGEKYAKGMTKDYTCKLFGAIPVGKIHATVRQAENVNAVGCPVGVYMKTKNVYVAGTKELRDQNGNQVCPVEYIVKEGDYILKANGADVKTKEELQEKVMQCHGQAMILRILRGGEEMDVKVQPVQTDVGSYCLGLWVKDDMAGVGTLTYVRDDGTYGALGHGISDSGTGQLLLLDYGYLYRANITSIKPSAIGSPGEITGMIAYGKSTRFGDIDKNSNEGIFGDVSSVGESALKKRMYPVGYKQDMRRDKATLLFGAEGNVQSYQIMIDQINYNPKEKNKAFVFHVTEKSLIDRMGGIVQGMSGAPIIQDGKIVGAVTHVFVNDPTKGYGIFIEDMIDR